MSSQHVVVVGGGVVGLATAFHLRRRGAEVTVLEADHVGAGASWGNAGWLVPVLSAPLPGPGMIRAAVRSLLDADGAFYLAPSQVLRLAPWLARFARASSRRRYLEGLRATARLAERAVDAFDELAAEGVVFDMRADDLVFACLDGSKAGQTLAELAPMRAYGCGVPETVEDGDALRLVEPALAPAVEAGFVVNGGRAVRPASLLAGLTERLRAMGVAVQEGARVTGFDHHADQVTGVRTNDKAYAAGAVVLATGAWTGMLTRRLGAPIPLQAGTGYSLSVEPRVPPRTSLYLVEAKAGTALHDNGRLRIAGTMALSGIRPRPDRRRLEALVRSVRPYLHKWEPDSESESWSGMRPMTPDGVPLIGVLPTARNVYLNTGHGMLGVTLAAVSASELATLILDGVTSDLIAPFTPARFSRRR